jgi:hypothetical protein
LKSLVSSGAIECITLEEGPYYKAGDLEGWFCVYRKQ